MRGSARDEDKQAPAMGTLESGEPSPMPPGALLGVPALPLPPPEAAKPYEPEFVPCVRDCRYYFRAESHFDAGNPAGSLTKAPRQTHRYCTAIPGVFLELSGDSPVYTCNQWDPAPLLIRRRERRQARWSRKHGLGGSDGRSNDSE